MSNLEFDIKLKRMTEHSIQKVPEDEEIEQDQTLAIVWLAPVWYRLIIFRKSPLFSISNFSKQIILHNSTQ
jgi:hypothetical protein